MLKTSCTNSNSSIFPVLIAKNLHNLKIVHCTSACFLPQIKVKPIFYVPITIHHAFFQTITTNPSKTPSSFNQRCTSEFIRIDLNKFTGHARGRRKIFRMRVFQSPIPFCKTLTSRKRNTLGEKQHVKLWG